MTGHDEAAPAARPTNTAPTAHSGRRRSVVQLVALGICLLLIAVLLVALREPSTIDNGHDLFTRTSPDGVVIDAASGDVRYQTHDGWTRAPGLLLTFTTPDGREGSAAVPAGRLRGQPAARLTTASLGIPPGSEDEYFTVIQTHRSVTRVRAYRTDGGFDEVAPVEGFAAFATVTGLYETKIEALDLAGTVIATV